MASVAEHQNKNSKGFHLNCDIDPNHPQRVCIGHVDPDTHEYKENIHRIQTLVTTTIQNQFKDDRTAVLTFHGSRPSHNNRLLTTQKQIIVNSSEPTHVQLLIRKEAPCDTRIYVELWIDSLERPWVLVGFGFFKLQSLLALSEDKDNTPIELNLVDINNSIQATISIQNQPESNNNNEYKLNHVCKETDSLTKQRKQLKTWTLESQYYTSVYSMYKQLQPGNEEHWYIDVSVPFKYETPLVTIVHSARYIAVESNLKGEVEPYWQLMFDLSCMQALFRPITTHQQWNALPYYQQALVINYMFALPWCGHIYVTDHTRASGQRHLDSDLWMDIRTRPTLATDANANAFVMDNVASFDCEDSVLTNHGTYHAFKGIKQLQSKLLDAVQTTLVHDYASIQLGIASIKVKNDNYMSHAFTLLTTTHTPATPILIEGTALTSGVWSFTEQKQEEVIYNHGIQYFDVLSKLDSTVEWDDIIQFSTPMSIVKEKNMYKDPVTLVSSYRLGAVEQRVFSSKTMMEDMVYMKRNQYQSFESKDHPIEPMECQSIAWLDTRTQNNDTNESPFECACVTTDRKHKYCLLYYVNPRFFKQHKDTINYGLDLFCGKELTFSVSRFQYGRELHLYRLCVCVT